MHPTRTPLRSTGTWVSRPCRSTLAWCGWAGVSPPENLVPEALEGNRVSLTSREHLLQVCNEAEALHGMERCIGYQVGPSESASPYRPLSAATSDSPSITISAGRTSSGAGRVSATWTSRSGSAFLNAPAGEAPNDHPDPEIHRPRVDIRVREQLQNNSLSKSENGVGSILIVGSRGDESATYENARQHAL